MAIYDRLSTYRWRLCWIALALSAIVLGARVYVWAQAAAANPNPNQQGAQILIGGQQQAVGGISIRADGLIENAGRDAEGKLRKLWTEAVKNTPVDF